MSFFREARALASWANEWAAAKQDTVMAVYFRDTDDRRSTPAGNWQDKWNAAIQGFKDESFDRGVPMLPKPTSEAWFICALKSDPYENCSALEERSGGPKSPKPLKAELRELLGTGATAEALCARVENHQVVASRIDMPSFTDFRNRLLHVLRGDSRPQDT